MQAYVFARLMYAQMFVHTQTHGDQPGSVTGGSGRMMFAERASVLFPGLEKGSAASAFGVRQPFKRGCQTADGDGCCWQLGMLQHQNSRLPPGWFTPSFAHLTLSGRVWCKRSRLFLTDYCSRLGGPTFAPLLQVADWFLQP